MSGPLKKAEIREQYEVMKLNDPDSRLSAQDRGRQLEQIIYHLLESEGLRPELGPKYRGEQIDISFSCRDRYHLLEAKWHSEMIQAGELYAFRGKLDGKLIGTVGIFLSISGYTVDAVTALAFGKEINIILFDETDWKYCMSDEHPFSSILEIKLRRAASYGDINYSYETYLNKTKI